MNNVFNYIFSNKWLRFLTVYISMVSCGIFFAFLAPLSISWLLDDSLGFGALGIVIIAALIGYPIGLVLALVFFRKKFYYQGSLKKGIVSVIACGALIVTLQIVFDGIFNLGSEALFSLYYLTLPMAGLFGYRFKAKETTID